MGSFSLYMFIIVTAILALKILFYNHVSWWYLVAVIVFWTVSEIVKELMY